MINKVSDGGPVNKPVVLGAESATTEIVSRRWLWFFALLGCLLVGLSVFLALKRSDINGIWSDVSLQFGSTVLLFSVLFYVERHFVRRVVRQTAEQLLRALHPDEPIPEEILNDPDTVLHSAAAETAKTWFFALVAGDFPTAWVLSEQNWPMCRAQARIWNSRHLLGLTDQEEMQSLAEELSKVQSEYPLWPTFINSERNELLKGISGTPPDRWAMASRRRCVGPGYELFVFSSLSDEYRHGLEVRAPTLVPNSLSVLMHLTPDGWQLAAFTAEAPPLPGWPPAWWIKYDPVAEAATDQMELVQRDRDPEQPENDGI